MSLTNLLVHVIFSTKTRKPFIDGRLKPRLHAYLGGIARDLECVPLEIGGVADHVHLLLRIPAKLSVSEIVGKVKANSSGWVHKEFPNQCDFAWQAGYAAFSVSESSKSRVLAYIGDQDAHHKQRSLQDELVAFLRRHPVPFELAELFD